VKGQIADVSKPSSSRFGGVIVSMEKGLLLTKRASNIGCGENRDSSHGSHPYHCAC
jgi:hypothetical protein